MHFNWDRLQAAHPAAVRPAFGMSLNPCEVIDCQAQRLFGADEVLQVIVDLGMDFAAGLQMETPLNFIVAVLNEEGRRVAGGEAFLAAGTRLTQRDAQITLSFRMLPSFTWRQSGVLSGQSGTDNRATTAIEADAALPAYHLLLVPENLSPQNRQILSTTPLRFRHRMTLTQQKQ
jgi:hypothetical protein